MSDSWAIDWLLSLLHEESGSLDASYRQLHDKFKVVLFVGKNHGLELFLEGLHGQPIGQ